MAKRINLAKAKKFQAGATRLFLIVGTLVLAAILSWVVISKIAVPVLGTQLRMLGIYQEISYCEEQREIALETNRGSYATKMDDRIRELNDERDALVKSDQFWIAFSAKNHVSLFAILCGILFLALVGGMWFLLFKVDGVFSTVLSFERIVLLVTIRIVFGLLFLIFSRLAKFFRIVTFQVQSQIPDFTVRRQKARHISHENKHPRNHLFVRHQHGKAG